MIGGKAALRLLGVVLPVVVSMTIPGHVAIADPYADMIAEAAERAQIPASWIAAVLHAESRGDAHAVSSAGGMGLMQVMPGTWSSLRTSLGLGDDPFDPHDNILAGATYLRWMRNRYGEAGFLAAYNAGPARYDEHLATGRPLPAETRNYVASVSARLALPLADDITTGAPLARSWQESSLFPASFLRTGDASRHVESPHNRGQANGARPTDWTALAPQSAGLFLASGHGEAR
ncbi:lytic transglycosylase [Gluconacetobacter liquefaciens]|uniref:Lytic transglycosylase domain-containing protein n=1 Tax=Gluconacetobacter liquefaciens TaxID=89584 RepID=A0A370GB71_GLULI|nr:lytic transglycosylase domain-containing protein [Gluconacetobacter liquefaciens]MBB2185440.1 lytic transglycosylase domain-containing protein [Gluconacetobacter liquefaciens]RDI39243.1 transglycosylase-like protein with SLT domain [Gluconacetobacter liquefaciens]GBQ93956.1 murein transglycosylase [Gluconacetobacter liquefaciens NRIC 0522]GEB38014.1 lytic transglycosylase [Gluconacetobacter liquefaciens]